MKNTHKAQEELNLAAKSASFDGVGFVAVICSDGSVSVRRDEIYAPSRKIKFTSVEKAIGFLRSEAAGCPEDYDHNDYGVR